jgi:carboxymethylenebutenolidase
MERWETIGADGGEMRCFIAAPDGAAGRPAVVVIQHPGGVDSFVQAMTRGFGEEGFCAIAPDLYHREDPANSDDPLTRMGRLRDAEIIRDVDAAVAYVRGLPEASDRLGITGFCMGGRVAYLIATERSDLGAAVVFYGGNIMVPWGAGEAPFAGSGRINCPVLGLFGADDQNPNAADVQKIDAELTRLGKAHEFHSYAGAGHAFMNEGRPSYRADAAADAWARCTAFFRSHLG